MVEFDKNEVVIVGTITNISKCFTVDDCDKRFKEYIISCNREMKTKSTIDNFVVIVSDELEDSVDPLGLSYWSKIKVIGQVRSYHETINGLKRLCIKIFASEIITNIEDKDQSELHICGSMCRFSEIRQTISNKYIFDFMLASNFKFHKAAYIPCIAFESIGNKLSKLAKVGTKFDVVGQLQTRCYFDKKTNNDRTITELCVKKFEVVPNNQQNNQLVANQMEDTND